MVNHPDALRRYAHADVLPLLRLADGHPAEDLLEERQAANVMGDHSHPSAVEMAVVPARGLEGGPEIAREAALAGLAVVEEKAVHARKAVVVQVMDDGDFPLQGQFVD